MHDGAAAVAAADRDQALGLEDAQRLPHRDEADVEVFDELLLARQQVAVGEPAVDDLLPQLVGDDLGGPARRQSTVRFRADPKDGHVLPAADTMSALGALPAVGTVVLKCDFNTDRASGECAAGLWMAHLA